MKESGPFSHSGIDYFGVKYSERLPHFQQMKDQVTVFVEIAPLIGGFYVRSTGFVKRSLRKAIIKLCLTNDQLLTF